jgi:hypothetical protein
LVILVGTGRVLLVAARGGRRRPACGLGFGGTALGFRRVRVAPNLPGPVATQRRQAMCSSSQSNMRCSVSSRAIGWQW